VVVTRRCPFPPRSPRHGRCWSCDFRPKHGHTGARSSVRAPPLGHGGGGVRFGYLLIWITTRVVRRGDVVVLRGRCAGARAGQPRSPSHHSCHTRDPRVVQTLEWCAAQTAKNTRCSSQSRRPGAERKDWPVVNRRRGYRRTPKQTNSVPSETNGAQTPRVHARGFNDDFPK
jgi:hypothetical protein